MFLIFSSFGFAQRIPSKKWFSSGNRRKTQNCEGDCFVWVLILLNHIKRGNRIEVNKVKFYK